MKAKLLTLALFGILTFGFISCTEEEVAPQDQVQLNGKSDRPPQAPGDLIYDR